MPASLVLHPQTRPGIPGDQAAQITRGQVDDFYWTSAQHRQKCMRCKNAAVARRDKLFDGPVAQLDRASAFEAEGWGFEPLRAHYFLPPKIFGH